MHEYWNLKNREVDQLHQIFAQNTIINSPLGKDIGRSFIKGVNEKWRHAIPNLEIKPSEFIAQQNKVVAIWEGSGNNDGPFNGFEGTSKPITYKGTTVFEFNDAGEIEAYTCYLDLLTVYQQMGYFLEREKYDGQRIARHNLDILLKKITSAKIGAKNLTKQEALCLSFWIHGMRAKDIGRLLDISYRTVQTYVGNIMLKWDCPSRAQLYDCVVAHGLAPILLDLQLAYQAQGHKQGQ